MEKFKEKKIANESAADLSLVAYENMVEDADGKYEEPNSVGLVLENPYDLLDEYSIQLELTKQQAIDLAADLLQAAFADRYDLEEKRPFFNEAGSFEPVVIGKNPEDSTLIGFLLQPNTEVMREIHILPEEGTQPYIISRENALRLIRLMLNQIKESIID